MGAEKRGFTGSPLMRRSIICIYATGILAWAPVTLAADSRESLAELPIEQLLTLEVYSASRFVQKLSEAPSSVSIVTAADIKAFGWRTIADILRSMRGLHVTNDRNYSYLGARGFQRPGDYNSRFLLLIDGNRSNEAIYDQASIGTEGLIDVDTIDRVEFIAGPGSSVYGANAFFGVINIITKSARDMKGAQASVEAGSNAMRKARASYGWRNEEGVELLLSAASFQHDGDSLYFPEFDTPATNNGIARHLDHDRYRNVLAKASAGPFSFRLAHVERTKGIPTASYSQVFNDPRSKTVDQQTSLDAGYRGALSQDVELISRVYWGAYNYTGDYVYDSPMVVMRDGSHSRWSGAEARIVSTGIRGHKFVAGVEAQRNTRLRQFNYDETTVHLDIDNSSSRQGIYIQDEITLRDNLLLNAGLRHDHHSGMSGVTNPRLGVIWKAAPATTLKALYGTAYRVPNAYELYYEIRAEGGQKANPALQAERIRSLEFVAEHHLSTDARLTAAVFRNQVTNLISQTLDPSDGLLVFHNLDSVTATGVEVELEKAWQHGALLRTSASLQRIRDKATGLEPTNSAPRLVKINWSTPIVTEAWRAGVEAHYMGSRKALRGEVPGGWLTNLTLVASRLAPGLEVAGTVYNLLNRDLPDPGGEEHLQAVLPQPGRHFRIKLTYTF
jgi:outer membrane cobalamin receptor